MNRFDLLVLAIATIEENTLESGSLEDVEMLARYRSGRCTEDDLRTIDNVIQLLAEDMLVAARKARWN